MATLLATAVICLIAATIVWVRTGMMTELIKEVEPIHAKAVRNSELDEMQKFATETRQLFNTRRFTDIEALVDRLRISKDLFPSGDWKLMHAYDSLACRDEEAESMWQLHEQIYQEWKAAYPASITARVAHARFMVAYAWHARGSDYADSVTEEGWQLFRERLASSHKILDESKTLAPCPVWWQARLRRDANPLLRHRANSQRLLPARVLRRRPGPSQEALHAHRAATNIQLLAQKRQ